MVHIQDKELVLHLAYKITQTNEKKLVQQAWNQPFIFITVIMSVSMLLAAWWAGSTALAHNWHQLIDKTHRMVV